MAPSGSSKWQLSIASVNLKVKLVSSFGSVLKLICLVGKVLNIFRLFSFFLSKKLAFYQVSSPELKLPEGNLPKLSPLLYSEVGAEKAWQFGSGKKGRKRVGEFMTTAEREEKGLPRNEFRS